MQGESELVAQASCLLGRLGVSPKHFVANLRHAGSSPAPPGKMPVLLMIERRRRGITITRGGPHRKSQRLERSIRSRSAFCGHTALFRADFLHAEGYPVVAMV